MRRKKDGGRGREGILHPMNRFVALSAVVLGFTAVLLGALGAHALPKTLDPHYLEVWKTAAHYHGLHAVALLALAAWRTESRLAIHAARCWVAGVVVFSGSLYLLVLSMASIGLPEARWLGAVTPLGGILLMLGWVLLGVAAYRGAK